MKTSSRSTVVGVFPDRAGAERAIDDLKRSGFRDDQIGIAARDAEDREGSIRSTGEDKAGDAAGGAAGGAVTGGVVGGVLGALAAGLIPGIGPVIAGGILAGVLGGAAVGAAAGGLIGALTGMGVSEDDARYYDEEFRGGRTLVTVKADDRYDEARGILHRHGGYDAESRGEFGGTTDTTARPMTGSRTAGASTESVELKQEELRAGKETVQAGTVGVEKDVVSERRTMDVPVTREEAVVERHPVDRRPSDSPISDREEIEVPLREERVTVDKQPVVYEEVEIGKRTVQDTEQVSGEVRREVADIRGVDDTTTRGTSTRSWDEVSPTYQQRWQQRYGTSGGRWSDYEPGYRYGYEMANDPRYRNRSW
ncbi:MAG TPA: YsnF/AvaK domain-containing protein, partial [Chloroflexota bacterium]|nr:YsnF/AvaK domain-containing protein [Chloroflexota bacterium]